MGVCAAKPRVTLGTPPFNDVAGNTVLLLLYIADLTEGTTCPYNVTSTRTSPGMVLCTGQQISPKLVLTASHCVDGNILKTVSGCGNSELVDVLGKLWAVAFTYAYLLCDW
jgi:hypothetical protein